MFSCRMIHLTRSSNADPAAQPSQPSFATLGVMLYPALNEADPPKARAYVAQVLAKAFSSFRDADETPPYDVLTPILMDGGEPLSDLQERWWGGRAAGELFKTFFALT